MNQAMISKQKTFPPSLHFSFPPSILSLPRSLPLHLSLLPHAAAVGIKCNGALPSMHIRVSHRRRRNAPPSCAAATRRSPQHSLQPPRSPAAAAATTFSPARPLSARRRAGALCVQGCVAYAIMPAHTHMHTCGYVMGWWRSCCRARRPRQRKQRGCRLCAGRRRQVRQGKCCRLLRRRSRRRQSLMATTAMLHGCDGGGCCWLL